MSTPRAPRAPQPWVMPGYVDPVAARRPAAPAEPAKPAAPPIDKARDESNRARWIAAAIAVALLLLSMWLNRT